MSRIFKQFWKQSIYGLCVVGLLFVVLYVFCTPSSKMNVIVSDESSTRTRQTVNNMVADINTYTKDNMIPRIIHQVWDDEIIPTQFVEYVKGLIAHNNAPDWQYYFWTHNSSRAFIRDKFPKFLHTFDNYPETLYRADAIRYFVLYEYGGVYLDLDTVSVKSLDPFIRQAKHTCVLTPEPEEHYVIRLYMKLLLSNNAMLCRRRHPFFRFLIDILPSFVLNGCKGEQGCTGPRFFTKAHEMYTTSISHPNDTTIVSPEYFQDVYDTKRLLQRVNDTCHELNLHNDKSRIAHSCKTWLERGGDKRNISSRAYTYHTWYHIKNKYNRRNVSFKPKNNVTLIVPHVKIYKSNAPI